MHSRWLPDTLSIARIPASLGLIAAYDPHPGPRLWITILLVIGIITSDFLDGRIARRSSIDCMSGYVIDGWADRAFHIAIYLILFDQKYFGICLVWIFVFREVTVYAVRAFDSTWHSTQTSAERTISKSHAAIIRLILLTELMRAGAHWRIDFQTYHLIVVVTLCVWNLISYVQLSRRFIITWRHLA